MSKEELEQRLRKSFDRDVEKARPKGSLIADVLPRLEARQPRKWWSGFVPRTRLAWITVPLGLAVIAASLAWQPWNLNGAQTAVAMAQAAMAKLQSYRMSLVIREGADEAPTITSHTMEFAAPDRYHETYTGEGGDSEEYILIGDRVYGKDVDLSSIGSSTGATLRTRAFSSMVTTEAATRMLDYLKDIKKFPDETVDGTVCLHYRGTVDFEKYYRGAIQHMQETNASEGLPPLSKETQEKMLNEARSIRGSQVIDMWIGKSDYLMRRMIQNIRGPNFEDMTQHAIMEFTFYDFNVPITIEAPVDANGQVLPGWTSASLIESGSRN